MVFLPKSDGDGVTRSSDAIPPGDRAAGRGLWFVSSGVFVAWAAHNALLLPWEMRTIDADVREPALVLLRGVVWLIPILFYLERYDPRPPLVALGVTSRISGKGLAWSAIGAVAYLSLMTWLVLATADPGAAPDVMATLLRPEILYLLLTVALEELLLRGFLLGQLVRFTSSGRAQSCVAVLFALMHLPAWLTLQGVGAYLVPSMLNLVVLGAVLGAVARGSNNILLAILLHFANNLLGELLGAG